jgi:hypothetical protein
VLSRRVVRRCNPAGAPHGTRRCGPQRHNAITLGLRGHRSRPRGDDKSSLMAVKTRPRCSRRSATRAPRPPGPTGSFSPRSRSCSWSPLGVCSYATHAAQRAERHTPTPRTRYLSRDQQKRN